MSDHLFDASRFLSGDRAYAAEVVRAHHGFVLSVCRAFARSGDEAEDLAQETWKAVVSNADTFRGMGSFRAWLHRIATNVCLSYMRSRKASIDGRRRYALEAGGEEPVIRPDGGVGIERRELRASVQGAIARLTERERTAVTLRVLEGRSTTEVAGMMEVTEATVRSHLRHGINHLRRIMEDPESDLHRHRAAR